MSKDDIISFEDAKARLAVFPDDAAVDVVAQHSEPIPLPNGSTQPVVAIIRAQGGAAAIARLELELLKDPGFLILDIK